MCIRDRCETIRDGDRIAQMVIMPYLGVELNEVGELVNTERGEGGFGSTGTRTEKVSDNGRGEVL